MSLRGSTKTGNQFGEEDGDEGSYAMTDYSPNSLVNETGCDHDFILAVTRARKRDLERWCFARNADPSSKAVRDEWLLRMGITEKEKV